MNDETTDLSSSHSIWGQLGNVAMISSGTASSPTIWVEGAAKAKTKAGTSIKATKRPGMPVQIFFSLMKKKMGILKDYSYSRRIKLLEQAVDKAQADGQIAFSEELMKRLFVLCREAELWAMGKKIFLDRPVFDRFRHKTQRSVSLTPLKNYARPIPQIVLDEKKRCDDAHLFDGYVIMHYDDPVTVKETEQEKQERRERDPILFGVVEYSDRLYFVADWEDEFCDLTLDDILNTLDLDETELTLSKKPVL